VLINGPQPVGSQSHPAGHVLARQMNPVAVLKNSLLPVERKMIAILANDDLRQKSGRGDGLILAPAERADLIVDFRDLHGQRLMLVNTAAAPFTGAGFDKEPGASDPEHRLPYPQVMQFRVGSEQSGSDLSAASVQRMVALVKHEVNEQDMFMLHELQPSSAPTTGEPLIAIEDESGVTTTYTTVAERFEDTVNFMIVDGSTEVWHFLNVTKNMHPMHLHLVQFQAIRRDLYDVSGFDDETFATKMPLRFKKQLEFAANELGPKDTIRVYPGERVSIAMTFHGYTGRYMYHCHMLEHEDMDMMRPYVVVTAGAMEGMGMEPPKKNLPMPM
jgi:FtsP/CotA-like multicopper oxidase with cupredoxin domain